MFHTSTSKKTLLYRLYSTPVKISEKSALDLRKLTHVVELNIPSKKSYIIQFYIIWNYYYFLMILSYPTWCCRR